MKKILMMLICFITMNTVYACRLDVRDTNTKKLKSYIVHEYPFKVKLPKTKWSCERK